jgi:hypothetical protein
MICNAIDNFKFHVCAATNTGVSDMANGGQVLMEAATFVAVHNWLAELSSVDHKGYNDALIKRTSAQSTTNNSVKECVSRHGSQRNMFGFS